MGQAADALANHYGISEAPLAFFQHYVEDASGDLPWEAEVLAEWACTTERQLTAARAFRYRLDIDYQYVQPLYAAITSGEMPLQVPAHQMAMSQQVTAP